MSTGDSIKYITDQIIVPSDYGTARCVCGGLLDYNRICIECRAAYDQAETIFWRGVL
jgi:hypothetical protein